VADDIEKPSLPARLVDRLRGNGRVAGSAQERPDVDDGDAQHVLSVEARPRQDPSWSVRRERLEPGGEMS
jgi:hypothetical protein